MTRHGHPIRGPRFEMIEMDSDMTVTSASHSLGFHWISLDFIGFHWISLDFIGFHWPSASQRFWNIYEYFGYFGAGDFIGNLGNPSWQLRWIWGSCSTSGSGCCLGASLRAYGFLMNFGQLRSSIPWSKEQSGRPMWTWRCWRPVPPFAFDWRRGPDKWLCQAQTGRARWCGLCGGNGWSVWLQMAADQNQNSAKLWDVHSLSWQR